MVKLTQIGENLVKSCTNPPRFVQTFADLGNLVRILSNLCNPAQTRTDLYKLAQTCSDSCKLTQIQVNLNKRPNSHKLVQVCANSRKLDRDLRYFLLILNSEFTTSVCMGRSAKAHTNPSGATRFSNFSILKRNKFCAPK